MNKNIILRQRLAPRVGAMQPRDSNGLPLLTYPKRPTKSCGVPRGFANLFWLVFHPQSIAGSLLTATISAGFASRAMRRAHQFLNQPQPFGYERRAFPKTTVRHGSKVAAGIHIERSNPLSRQLYKTTPAGYADRGSEDAAPFRNLRRRGLQPLVADRLRSKWPVLPTASEALRCTRFCIRQRRGRLSHTHSCRAPLFDFGKGLLKRGDKAVIRPSALPGAIPACRKYPSSDAKLAHGNAGGVGAALKGDKFGFFDHASLIHHHKKMARCYLVVDIR